MKYPAALLVGAALFLSGCANIDYATNEYGRTPMVLFEYRDTTWRVWDKPEQNKMMVSSNLGAAAGDGFIRGLSLGLVNTAPGEPTVHAVVDAYLTSKARKCQAGPGQLIQTPQWEFRYLCDGT